MKKFDPSLYFITDSTNYTEEEFLYRVEEALKGGITLLQLREKNKSTREYIDLAKKVHSMAKRYNVPLIIDDRVDVALALSSSAAVLGSSAFIMADTTQIPAMGMPARMSMLSLLSPPIALAGIGTALQISRSVSVEVKTVFTLVVVG